MSIDTQQVAEAKDKVKEKDVLLSVRDLHIWAPGTSQVALTAHLVMPAGSDDAFLQHAADELHAHFEITHVTLQVMRTPFVALKVPGVQNAAALR